MDATLAAALVAALDPHEATRRHGEEVLRAAAAEPGFCPLLLALTDARSQLPDGVRLLAATQLKNEAVRHWRRGAQAAHEHERTSLRAALVARLTQHEAFELVSVQIALAVARVMRSEANTGEATVLEAFAQTTLACERLPDHALLALLHTAKEISTMRLPAQRRLAARIGHVMMGLVGPRWEATIRAVLSGEAAAATPAVLHAAVLHTKVLRRLVTLAALGGPTSAPPTGAPVTSTADDASASAVCTLTTMCSLAVEAAASVQRACGAVPDACAVEASKLGGALGKLLCALHKTSASAAAQCELLDAAATMLVVEADARCALRSRVVPGAEEAAAAGSAAASAASAAAASTSSAASAASASAEAIQQLEVRERHGSTLAARLASLLEQRGVEDEAWLARCAAGGRYVVLVRALVALLARPVEQLRRWSADAESFACEVLLPLDDDDDVDESAEALGLYDEEDADDYNSVGGGDGGDAGSDDDADDADANDADADGGGGGGSDQGYSSGSSSDVLQREAQGALLALLYAAPDEVSAAILQLLPASSCAPFEALDAQLFRDACYTALGLSACMLEGQAVAFSHVFAAVLREAEAIAAARAANPAFVVGAPLQARLCWLLSCWWAFGSSGDEAEDQRLCAASYGFLASLAHGGIDLGVRLQAAHILRTVLMTAHDDDVTESFAPHATLALAGLAGTLAICTSDDAQLCVLRATRTLLRRLPAMVQSAPMRDSMAPVLNALWQCAEREQRVMLQRALRQILPPPPAAP